MGNIKRSDILIIIPARKGSSFERKNLRLLNGKPLVRYTIEAAAEVQIKHDTMISTDDPYIAEEGFSKNCLIDERPSNLADDSVTLDNVMFYIAAQYSDYSTYICLPPTSPLRNSYHIEEAIGIFLNSKADSLVSVTEEKKSIWSKDEDGFLRPIVNRTENRQQVEPNYISNGAMFISKREMIIKNRKKASGRTLPYVMDGYLSIDIHNETDLKAAEFYLKDI